MTLYLSNRVLHSLTDPLLEAKYHIIRYNSRGVGKSTGFSSFTGFSETEDLKALVQWALGRIGNITSVVLIVSHFDACKMKFVVLTDQQGLFARVFNHLPASCATCTHKDITCSRFVSARSERMADIVSSISLPKAARRLVVERASGERTCSIR
jgi:alpha/beta superfamily hydrolase